MAWDTLGPLGPWALGGLPGLVRLCLPKGMSVEITINSHVVCIVID